MHPLSPALRTSEPTLRFVPADPTQELLQEIKATSPWLYESLRAGGLVLDEDLPTITY